MYTDAGYGVVETNPIGEVHPCHSLQGERWLGDTDLARITRLRLLTERGYPFFDVSYCYGETTDGTPVRVHLPRYQFGRKTIKREIVDMCREAGVYAKGLGLLDEGVWSILYG